MNAESKTVLSCENLTKSFEVGGRMVPVINGISCEFKEGEFVSIMGPSGSGKSTLLYLLSGIEKMSGGTVQILGKDLNSLKNKEISAMRSTDIGFIFQNYNLIPTFSVYENIIAPLLISKRDIDENEINEIMQNINIFKLRDKNVLELSGGEQQRVAIARALASHPKVLFADEPTGNLDSKNGKEVMKLFSNINDSTNTTIIQITHSEIMAEYSDRIIRLVDGKIVSDEKVVKNNI